MRREGLVWENGPNVSVNANSSDSHYEPTAERSAAIPDGDFILIDIWARLDKARQRSITTSPGPASSAANPRASEQLVFETVRNARDAAIATVEKAFAAEPPHPRLRRRRCRPRRHPRAGFGEFFTHRTGHNIAQELHGPGAHLDNLETHDERRILPNTCFSVEPGIYLPEFGVRSEIDMLTAPGKAWVTGNIQRELVRI